MTTLSRVETIGTTPAPPWPQGYRCAAWAAAIKKAGVNDIALLVADAPVSAAAVFTKNLVAAAPIGVSRDHLALSRGQARALLINSGCANAATGEEGVLRARRSTAAVAQALAIDSAAVLVNSTGVIGVPLPIDKIERAIPSLVASLASGSCEPFARAIMTTDTRPKWSSRTIRVMHDGVDHEYRVTGVAKGAGMIHPNMATMIAVIATDAPLAPTVLDGVLRDAVEGSFHRISIDGDTSTNDSVFAFAHRPSGGGGAIPIEPVRDAFREVAADLAQLIVRDGEGFERGIEVSAVHAASQHDALTVARTVAMSLLVRTAVTGGDPNWGRILAAAGRAGVAFDPNRIRVSAGGTLLFADGRPAEGNLADIREAFTADTVRIEIDLASGPHSDRFWSCGLTTRYVELNADYTT